MERDYWEEAQRIYASIEELSRKADSAASKANHYKADAAAHAAQADAFRAATEAKAALLHSALLMADARRNDTAHGGSTRDGVCDIHVHAEVKIDGEWHHYGAYDPAQLYKVFALLAGVRQGAEPVVPLSEPRGLPEDASRMTRFCHDLRGEDAHTASWLALDELGPLHQLLRQYSRDYEIGNWLAGAGPHFDHPAEVYLFRNGWEEPPEEKGVEGVRLVFWFDN